MWHRLPCDVQGEVLSYAHAAVWYRLTKTCKGGMDLFPSSSVTHLDASGGTMKMSWRRIREVSVDFHLPNLRSILAPPFTKVFTQTKDFYVAKDVLKKFPRARLILSDDMSMEHFLAYAAGELNPASMQWFDRCDAFSVHLKAKLADGPIPNLLHMSAPRLLQGGYRLFLIAHEDIVTLHFKTSPDFWKALFRGASKLSIHLPRPNSVKVSSLILPLGYPVSVYAPCRTHIMPSLRRGQSVDDLDPRYIQSPTMACEDAESILYFLDHASTFLKRGIAMVISTETMTALPPDMWCRILSEGYTPESVDTLAVAFLIHMDVDWCNDAATLDKIAALLVELMVNRGTTLFNLDYFCGAVGCKHLKFKRDAMVRHASQWALTSEAAASMVHLLKNMLMPSDRFFDKIGALKVVDWSAAKK